MINICDKEHIICCKILNELEKSKNILNNKIEELNKNSKENELNINYKDSNNNIIIRKRI